MGEVLEDAVQLDRSEEAELWVECVAGQVLLPHEARALPVGAWCSCAGAAHVTTPSCLPCLAARSHHPQFWHVPGAAGRF